MKGVVLRSDLSRVAAENWNKSVELDPESWSCRTCLVLQLKQNWSVLITASESLQGRNQLVLSSDWVWVARALPEGEVEEFHRRRVEPGRSSCVCFLCLCLKWNVSIDLFPNEFVILLKNKLFRKQDHSEVKRSDSELTPFLALHLFVDLFGRIWLLFFFGPLKTILYWTRSFSRFGTRWESFSHRGRRVTTKTFSGVSTSNNCFRSDPIPTQWTERILVGEKGWSVQPGFRLRRVCVQSCFLVLTSVALTFHGLKEMATGMGVCRCRSVRRVG